MAPEQLEGGEIDARSDVWALGVVVYEMVCGVRPFRGDSPAGLIASILGAPAPPVSEQRPGAPPALDALVRGCLARDPEERWQSAADVGKQLRWIAAEEPGRALARPRARPLLALASLVLGVAIGLSVSLHRLRAVSPASEPVHLDVALAPGQTLEFSASGVRWPFAVSSDGRRIVYVASEGGHSVLRLRDLGGIGDRPLEGSEGGQSPFFSPDGRWVGFQAGGVLRKVSVEGGAPLTVCPLPSALFHGAVWVSEETIVFSPEANHPLYQVPADGGQPTPLTALADDELGHAFPARYPGGSVLFTVSRQGEQLAAVASLETGEHRTLATVTGAVRYVSPGYLVYGRGGGLWAVPFDAEAFRARGGPQPVLDGVATGNTASRDVAYFSVSASGCRGFGHPCRRIRGMP